MRYAISDIHGCLKTFIALLDRIAFSQADELYLLGDYIDRGEASKGVLDKIMELQSTGYQVHCLLGNHDRMMLEARQEEENLYYWQRNGGWSTLDSFKCSNLEEIPSLYFEFLEKMPCLIETGNYLLAHAGLNFQAPDPLKDEIAQLWIRNWYKDIDYDWLGDRYILHGHTPLYQDEFEKQLRDFPDNRYLDIDCGCVFDQAKVFPSMGRLCAFNLDLQTAVLQINVED
jgi:serine/threonine protein phosphatase 1